MSRPHWPTWTSPPADLPADGSGGSGMGDSDPTGAIARLLPRLAPAAVLLTDDPHEAVALLGAALSRSGALDSPEAALRALARAAEHRPGWAAEQLIESLDRTPPADDDVALADALRSLPTATRIAVVLGTDPAAETALRAALAAADAEAVRARDRETAAFRPAGAVPDDQRPPPLPERLAELAAGRRLPSTAADTIAAAVLAVRRSRRRRRLQLAAGAALVLAPAVVVPLLPRGAAAPPTARPATSVFTGTTTGSLAGDEEFLRDLRDLDWPPAREADTRRVVFAGDVPGGRWALLTAGGTRTQPAAVGWFTGPQGATADRMVLVSGRNSPDPAEPVALTDPATGTLVVVAAADDQLAVSARPEVGADGTVQRTFGLVPTSNGVAELHLTPAPGAAGSAVQLLWRRAGRPPQSLSPAVVPTDAVPATPATRRLHPAPAPAVGDAAVGPQLASVLARLGQPAADAAVTTLWAGDLPGPNDRPARLTVLAVAQPSGAYVVTAPYGYAADLTGRAGGSWCVTGVLPAGEPLDRRVIAVQCDISDGTVDREVSRFLVVLAPSGTSSVQLLDAGGTVLSDHPVTDGVAVVRSPGTSPGSRPAEPTARPPRPRCCGTPTSPADR